MVEIFDVHVILHYDDEKFVVCGDGCYNITLIAADPDFFRDLARAMKRLRRPKGHPRKWNASGRNPKRQSSRKTKNRSELHRRILEKDRPSQYTSE